MRTRVIVALAVALGASVAAWKFTSAMIGSVGDQRGLASIRVPDGFEVKLAAKPGLVSYPMLGAFDDRGRLFLCESSGKTMKTPEMSADPNYIVSLLEDTDGDGVFDKTTVFADKLTLPAGAAWYRGSLYVAAPPSLFRLQDTNGDGVADVREIVVTGWNLSANAASLHGPILGPDGWLYLTDGRHGFKIDTKDGRHYEGKASRIWRVRPDGTGLEWYAGGGFDNPVEVAFTEGGDMFGTMTYFQDPRDGQRDAILHFVEGGVYPKPYPVTDEFKRTGDLMPVMTKFPRIAPSGLARYRGASFGPDYQGNLFTAQFNSHRVQRHQVSRNVASYKTQDTDFFVASDPDLHPTDVIEDADGSLIVVDTGAWFIHGCPLSRTAKPDVRGSLYRVTRRGAPKVANARGAKGELEAEPEKLARLLDDPRPAVADAAVEKLVQANAAPALAAFRPEAKTLAGATAAVYALSRIGAATALREALSDPRMEVRQAAARQLGMARDVEAVPALMEFVRRPEPPLRRQAAASLGVIGDRRAVPALLEAAAQPDDRFVEHSVIYSLIQLGDAPALLPALKSPNAAVRKAALIALDQIDRSPLTESHLLPFLEEENQELRKAAYWVVSHHKAWSPKLARYMEARLRSPQFSPEESALADAMATFCADSAMQAVMGRTLGDAALPAGRQMFVLDVAERCNALPAEWTPGLDRLLAHPDVKVRVRAIGLLRTRGVTSLDGKLRQLASAAQEPDDVRIAALSALRGPLSDSHFQYLAGRLGPQVDAAAKLAAGQVIGRAELNEAQLLDIAQTHLKKADPLVLPNLLDTFRNSHSEAAGKALVESLVALESSLGTVGAQRVQELVAKFPPTVQAAAKPVLTKLDAERNSRLDKLRKLEPVLAKRGDVARGREIFFGSKSGCGSCHTIGPEGGHVGPDLTSIGAIRSPHDLLEAIVLPSESFVPGHEVYRVETAREMFSGVLGRNAPDAVILITGPNDEVRIPRKDVVKMGYAPVSLMPEGFDEVLNQQEMADLMAFLRAQISPTSAAARRNGEN